MPKTEPLFYVKGNVIYKRPVRRKTATGTNITVGFPVCTASEYIEASAIAAIFNENERPEVDAPSPAVRTRRESCPRYERCEEGRCECHCLDAAPQSPQETETP